jgi:Zn ribbon nucleic-acid-binding protein
MSKHLAVECLRCGHPRELQLQPWSLLDSGECPACGYVGWARSAELTEMVRQSLRERPPEFRRMRPI